MIELKIIAAITVKADFQKEMEEIFYAVIDGTRKEEGNISYDLHQDVKNPLKYTILEVWKSQEAIKIHNETPHFKTFVKAIEGKVEGLVVDIVKKVY